MSKWEFKSPQWLGWEREGNLQFNHRDWKFTGNSTAEGHFLVAPADENEPRHNHVHMKDVVRVSRTTWPKLVGKGAGVELAETLFSACAEAGDRVSIDRLVVRTKSKVLTEVNRRDLVERLNEIADGAFQLTWRGDPHKSNWSSTNTHYRKWSSGRNSYEANSIKPNHPILLKSIIEGLSPSKYCAKICEGRGTGCRMNVENVLAMMHIDDTLDRRMDEKLFNCATAARKSER